MIDIIDLVRANSQVVDKYDNEPLFAAAQPALLRRTSQPEKFQIQIPNLEEEKVAIQVIIDTGKAEEEVYVPAVPFCEKTLDCGHSCKGVSKERKCLPCLNTECAQKVGHFEGVNEDELCTICYTQELGAEACTRLSCGHVFHTNCVNELLKHKWATLRITFSFMSCPSCKQEIELKGVSQPIAAELGPLLGLKKVVEEQALINAKDQGILEDKRLNNIDDIYYGKPQEFVNHRCAFYQCYGCKKPYFGGLIDCEQEMNNAEKRNTKPEDLLCQECLLKDIGAGQEICEKHGKEQIDWKCMFCCSQARYHCFGTHYMCPNCHDNEWNMGNTPPLKDCHGIDCPLGIAHPPPSNNPREGGCFSLGCGICRSEKLELLENKEVQQVINAANLPKAFIYNAPKPMKGVVYPEVVHEMPDFIAQAEEILEAELEAERERIRILNKTPVNFLNPRQIAKKERAAKRKLQKNLLDDNLPAWFINPLNEQEADEIERQEAERIQFDKEEQNKVIQLEAEQIAQEIALENEKAKKKTNEMQRKALKVICGLAPKKARVMRRNK